MRGRERERGRQYLKGQSGRTWRLLRKERRGTYICDAYRVSESTRKYMRGRGEGWQGDGERGGGK